MRDINVDELLGKLTLEEKISLLAGGSAWVTKPIPEKGIPCVKTTDGPNGARGSRIKDGESAACFPAACSVAATFDVDIARRIGVALGEEARTKGARSLLAPTVCIHRHPLGGRNFESFSEDPFLSGQMGIANVTGLQSTGVSATVKHFAANEQETQRLNVNAVVAERPLREIYLKPFEMIVKKANPWAIMTSYNKINGNHADSNLFLLQQVLRGEWKWDGLVMSDWGGVNSTVASLNAGVGLEMPGPARWRKKPAVLAAMQDGELTEATINERARHILLFLKQLRCFDEPTYSDPGEEAINKPEHAALIREAGAKGIVLLKNQDECLPLRKEKLRGKKVAAFGYAKQCLAHGGGSASVKPHYRISPWDALEEALRGWDVELSYARGAHTFRQLPLLVDNVYDLTGNPGFTYNVCEVGNPTPKETIHGYDKSEMSLLDGHTLENVEVNLMATFRPQETATYYFTISSLGVAQLSIDNKVVLQQNENCNDAMGFLFGGVPVPLVKVHMEKGKQYSIHIHASPLTSTKGQDLGFLEGQVGVRLGNMSSVEYEADVLSEAVDLAKESNYSIIFVGNDPSWETEGQDQASFYLPKEGSQDKLVAAVAAVCPRTIVVNSTGVATALPWINQVQGLIHTWFPGQEAGNSIVDVLTGAQNPEGHLPCTFPKRLEDCPAYGNFPGTYNSTDGFQVNYEEGVFVGYRHFDRLSPEKVNFPFGFGLSYTSFEISNLNIEKPLENLYTLTAKFTNVGKVKGGIAVQAYVGRHAQLPDDLVKVLVGFKKVTLEAGQSSVVEIPILTRDFAIWDEKLQKWLVESGDYVFSVAKSCMDVLATSTIAVERSIYEP